MGSACQRPKGWMEAQAQEEGHGEEKTGQGLPGVGQGELRLFEGLAGAAFEDRKQGGHQEDGGAGDDEPQEGGLGYLSGHRVCAGIRRLRTRPG